MTIFGEVQAHDKTDAREYSRNALLGVAVPQANPIVEPEFGALIPQGVGVIATRLKGSRTNSSNRLTQYLENLGESLDAYDTARPDVLGYACTGSSYLLSEEEERRLIGEQEERLGYRIITAASAILDALNYLGATKVALLAPYPQWLIDAGTEYWTQRGLDIVDESRSMLDTDDTRHVYQIRNEAVVEAARKLNMSNADVVLISGTGMPTLRAIPEIARITGKPVISSNLCLAWAMLGSVGVTVQPSRGKGETLLGGWAERADLL